MGTAHRAGWAPGQGVNRSLDRFELFFPRASVGVQRGSVFWELKGMGSGSFCGDGREAGAGILLLRCLVTLQPSIVCVTQVPSLLSSYSGTTTCGRRSTFGSKMPGWALPYLSSTSSSCQSLPLGCAHTSSLLPAR